MLWDDDAEGGDSLRLVLMEREAAAAYSHDLAGEGETDSASFRLRGEERDENVGGYIFGDETGVVAHVDDDGFLGVGIGFETDKCLLACRGLQFRGATFLLVFSFLFLESFYGILQKIRYYVREEALVGVNQQILGSNRNLYFVVAEHRHSFQEWFHIEESRLRLGNMGETAIVVDESQQFGSCFVDGFQALLQVFILCNSGKQSLAQRSNRRDGIHDFMGQHTNQFDPRIHLLIAQLVAHVAQGDDAHVLVFQHGLRLMLCQVFILQFPFYLVHVGKHIRIEQPEGCLIVLQDVVVTIHHQDARIHRIQNLLVIFLPIHLLLSRMLQEELDSVEGLMQNLILLKPLLRRKTEGEIPIIYRIKKEGYLLDVAAIVAVKPDVDCY